ncbi:hypothetical protein QAD02_020682 [Eretmocerus hayati]|uniref:Uncharacterized protein n=1 Tax=Eretmocerus hayati TaxID=131215 RepID=A0ACC2PQM5_9HYME|nr:hypothetical protein QAD02_020682 [Eretmocerus hayati]
MVVYTQGQYAIMVEFYVITEHNALAASRRCRDHPLFPIGERPSAGTILRVVLRLRDPLEALVPRRIPGYRDRPVLHGDNEDMIIEYYEENPTNSLKDGERDLNISDTSI